MPVPEDIPEKAMTMFTAMMQIEWLMPLLGVAEVVGGMLFIIPRTRALAAVMLTPIMVGIVLSHISLGESLLIPLVMTAVLIWVIAENWNKYLPMIEKA